MKESMLVFNCSGVYEAQGFLQFLAGEKAEVELLDLTGTEGTCCYCDGDAEAAIVAGLPERLPFLRWLDSGDYHYLSHLLALKEKAPFHLVLLDHHPDNQEPAFGGVLSCGGWVKEALGKNPMLRSVLTVGPEGCPSALEDAWIEERRGERVYVSLDKDVMARAYARTDWTQGEYTLEEVEEMLGRLLDGRMEVAAVDICGELSPSKGATPEDLRINFDTNKELYNFILKQTRDYV